MTDINDPIDWALDPLTGDRVITAAAGASFATGLTAVRQNVEGALSLIKGEWFYDLDRGVAFYQEVVEKATTLARIKDIYREQIFTVQDVLEILTLTINFNGVTRTAAIYFEVLTTFGTTSGNV